jgi:hypothetical protein
MIDTILAVGAGYCACIIFPCPVLSQKVLNGWAILKAKLFSSAAVPVSAAVAAAAAAAAPAAAAAAAPAAAAAAAPAAAAAAAPAAAAAVAAAAPIVVVDSKV